jgi:hypothetical protein
VKWTEENHKKNSNFQFGGYLTNNYMDMLETVVKALHEKMKLKMTKINTDYIMRKETSW